jgi:hypothetical protein
MGRHVAKAKSNSRTHRREWPLVVYVWIIGLGFSGYLVVGRMILASQPHPVHWTAALAGAGLGVPIGWLWYRWRGDILF